MKDSTRRALRTAYQAIIAAVPVVLIVALWLKDVFPADSPTTKITLAVSGGMIAVTTAVTKLLNALEAAGKIPAWLKQPAATSANPDPEAPPTNDVQPLAGRHEAPTDGTQGKLQGG